MLRRWVRHSEGLLLRLSRRIASFSEGVGGVACLLAFAGSEIGGQRLLYFDYCSTHALRMQAELYICIQYTVLIQYERTS